MYLDAYCISDRNKIEGKTKTNLSNIILRKKKLETNSKINIVFVNNSWNSTGEKVFFFFVTFPGVRTW